MIYNELHPNPNRKPLQNIMIFFFFESMYFYVERRHFLSEKVNYFACLREKKKRKKNNFRYASYKIRSATVSYLSFIISGILYQ